LKENAKHKCNSRYKWWNFTHRYTDYLEMVG